MSRLELLQALAPEIEEECRLVANVIESLDRGPRAKFRTHFDAQTNQIVRCTGLALAMLNTLIYRLDADDQPRLEVLAILHTSISLQITSSKLFLCGHTVAAGALFRQVIEGVCLAFLCSAQSLPYLKRFEAGTYTANGAVADLKRNARSANVRPEAMKVTLDAYRFYHSFAHISRLTIAAGIDFSRGGTSQIGAYFDKDKLPEYAKEARSRAKFAGALPNAVVGIATNLAKWK